MFCERGETCSELKIQNMQKTWWLWLSVFIENTSLSRRNVDFLNGSAMKPQAVCSFCAVFLVYISDLLPRQWRNIFPDCVDSEFARSNMQFLFCFHLFDCMRWKDCLVTHEKKIWFQFFLRMIALLLKCCFSPCVFPSQFPLWCGVMLLLSTCASEVACKMHKDLFSSGTKISFRQAIIQQLQTRKFWPRVWVLFSQLASKYIIKYRSWTIKFWPRDSCFLSWHPITKCAWWRCLTINKN